MRELGGSLVSLGCNYCLFLKTKYVVSKIFGFMSVDQKLGPATECDFPAKKILNVPLEY